MRKSRNNQMALRRSLQKQELQIANCKWFWGLSEKTKTKHKKLEALQEWHLQGRDPVAAPEDGEQIHVSYIFSRNKTSVSFYCVGKKFVQVFRKKHVLGKLHKQKLLANLK